MAPALFIHMEAYWVSNQVPLWWQVLQYKKVARDVLLYADDMDKNASPEA